MDITREKQAESRIQKSLEEKEFLLKEVHHRVKNNLQIVASIIQMESDMNPDKFAQKYLNNTLMRVQAIDSLHKELYEYHDLQRIDMNKYLTSIVSQILSIYQTGISNKKIVFDIADIMMNIENAMPCGFIISELVTNSIKYAFPGDSSGEIGIVLKNTTTGFLLIAYDTGVGLARDFDMGSDSGLGLQLVSILVTQLHGDITADNQNGIKCTITFNTEI
jgi:two-component sensor histidine kinase